MNMDKRWVIAAAFIILIIFGAGIKYSDYKHSQQAKEDIVLKSDKSQDETAPEAAKIIEVYITGAVTHPGVYRLKEGDRMYQAVELAGGAREDADISHLEMARPLIDGETIPIPCQGEVPEMMTANNGGYTSPANSGQSSGGRVNINTASAQEMADNLDGIGSGLGERIVDYRNNNGMFKDIEEIKNVSGIGEKRYEAIKDKITVR